MSLKKSSLLVLLVALFGCKSDPEKAKESPIAQVAKVNRVSDDNYIGQWVDVSGQDTGVVVITKVYDNGYQIGSGKGYKKMGENT